jgi:large subunit ribosomal protein L6e
VDAARVKDQKEVDKTVLAAVKKVSGLKSYLNASFALGKGEYPHLMKF